MVYNRILYWAINQRWGFQTLSFATSNFSNWALRRKRWSFFVEGGEGDGVLPDKKSRSNCIKQSVSRIKDVETCAVFKKYLPMIGAIGVNHFLNCMISGLWLNTDLTVCMEGMLNFKRQYDSYIYLLFGALPSGGQHLNAQASQPHVFIYWIKRLCDGCLF